MVKHVRKKVDTGKFDCIAVNRAGDQARMSTDIEVIGKEHFYKLLIKCYIHLQSLSIEKIMKERAWKIRTIFFSFFRDGHSGEGGDTYPHFEL